MISPVSIRPSDPASSFNFDFSRNPVQQAFMTCTTKFQNYCGGFGSGKTTACCAKVIICSALMPGNLWAVCRSTYPDLRDTTRRTLLEMLPEDWIADKKEAEGRWILKNKSEIIFRHFEEGRIKVGANLGGFFIDQAEEASEDIFNGLVGRLRRNVPRQYGLLAMNPNGRDWQHKLFVQSKDSDFSNFDSTTFDNEANLPKGYIQSMMDRYPADWIDRFVYGKWSTLSGLIYHEFDEVVNMCDPFDIPADWPKVRGLDWGIDAPATCVIITRSPEGVYYVAAEYGATNRTVTEHADEIKLLSKPFKRFDGNILDASAFHRESDLKSIADQYRREGIHCLPGTKDQLARIMLVKSLLKSGRLVYFRDKTPELLAETQAWKWGARKNGREVPAHGNDHYLDAQGYAIYWLHNRHMAKKDAVAEPIIREAPKLLSRRGPALVCDPITGIPL